MTREEYQKKIDEIKNKKMRWTLRLNKYTRSLETPY